MATDGQVVNEATRDALQDDNCEEEDENDNVVNIYKNIEPDDCYHLDFYSGVDMLGPSVHLRDQYDDIESMWTPLEEHTDPYTWNDVKTAFLKASEVVGQRRFAEELVWFASGSYAESSFFSIICEASESECRQKLFGDDCSGVGLRHFQAYMKESKTKRKMSTVLLNVNDYDYMLTPKSLVLSDKDCVLRKTDTPGFVKLQILNSDVRDSWSDCCFTQGGSEPEEVFLCPTKVKKNLERIFSRMEKDGPFIVKQGSVAFQVAHLSNVLGGITFYDIVFAIKCTFWPSIASKWITRPRQWPSKEDIEAITAYGCHLVPKVNPFKGDTQDWRVSFSEAEVNLTNLPLIYHYGIIHWRILKSLFSTHLQLNAHPKLITSYNLKTLFLFALERVKSDNWLNKEHLLKSILGILDDLVACLATHDCPHYFIPEVNLFEYQMPHDDFYPMAAKQVLSLRKQVAEQPKKMVFGDG